MKKSKQTEIFKHNFAQLCIMHKEQKAVVLEKLGLPRNYVTLLGLVRIANYFSVSISALLEKTKGENN